MQNGARALTKRLAIAAVPSGGWPASVNRRAKGKAPAGELGPHLNAWIGAKGTPGIGDDSRPPPLFLTVGTTFHRFLDPVGSRPDLQRHKPRAVRRALGVGTGHQDCQQIG